LVRHAGSRLLISTTGFRAVSGTIRQLTLRAVGVVTDVTAPAAPRVIRRHVRVVLRVVDGSPDRLAIEIRTRTGRLLFSSRWSGSTTVLQALARGAGVARW